RTVGTFGSKEPVVLFNAVLSGYVFRDIQMKRRSIGAANVNVGGVSRDDGQHAGAVIALNKRVGVVVYKVVRVDEPIIIKNVLKGLGRIDAWIAGIHEGYMNALAGITFGVHFVYAHQRQLFGRRQRRSQ